MITDVKHITITKSILHIINKGGSYFNNSLLPNNDSEFNAFLARHVKASVKTHFRKSATFKHKNINNPYIYIKSMFKNDTEFINNSKLLAHSLVNTCTIKNTGPYDLIFCEYENDANERFLAIILLEFTKSFFHEIINTSALIKHITVLASSNSSLKKCVLIPLENVGFDYDFLLNDKSLADFFLTDFLDSKIHMDDRKATATFVEQTIRWVNEKCEDPLLQDDIKEKLEEVKSECISSINRLETLDLDAFQDNIFRDALEHYKEEFNTNLENHGLICKEISFSDDVTTEYKYQKIKLDNNAEIKIPIALIGNNDYTDDYNRSRKENGNTEFRLEGRITSETVKSR